MEANKSDTFHVAAAGGGSAVVPLEGVLHGCVNVGPPFCFSRIGSCKISRTLPPHANVPCESCRTHVYGFRSEGGRATVSHVYGFRRATVSHVYAFRRIPQWDPECRCAPHERARALRHPHARAHTPRHPRAHAHTLRYPHAQICVCACEGPPGGVAINPSTGCVRNQPARFGRAETDPGFQTPFRTPCAKRHAPRQTTRHCIHARGPACVRATVHACVRARARLRQRFTMFFDHALRGAPANAFFRPHAVQTPYHLL